MQRGPQAWSLENAHERHRRHSWQREPQRPTRTADMEATDRAWLRRWAAGTLTHRRRDGKSTAFWGNVLAKGTADVVMRSVISPKEATGRGCAE